MTSKFDSLNNEFNVDGDIVQSEIVNEKIQKDYNLLKSSKQQMSEEEALKIIGGDLNLWGVGGNDALKGPPKFNINKKGEINND